MIMEPIVDGLEDDFGEQVEFRRIDAGTDQGQTTFRAYSLRGHPAFVIVDPEGAVLWTGLGEQTRQALMDQMHQVLKKHPD